MVPYGTEVVGMQRDWNEELQSCREFSRENLQDRWLSNFREVRLSPCLPVAAVLWTAFFCCIILHMWCFGFQVPASNKDMLGFWCLLLRGTQGRSGECLWRS